MRNYEFQPRHEEAGEIAIDYIKHKPLVEDILSNHFLPRIEKVEQIANEEQAKFYDSLKNGKFYDPVASCLERARHAATSLGNIVENGGLPHPVDILAAGEHIEHGHALPEERRQISTPEKLEVLGTWHLTLAEHMNGTGHEHKETAHQMLFLSEQMARIRNEKRKVSKKVIPRRAHNY